MGDRWVLFFYVIITSYIQVNHGCSIDGIPNWLLPQNIRILDSDSGIIYRKSTTGIEAINSVTHRTEGLNGGPYVNVSLVDSELTISTRDNYKTYEDIETAQSIGFTANFRCADGSSRNLVFSIDITDTNNNDPVFKPSNSYELTLAPPVPPNFLLTNCISDIIVRDIDLTTERIDFTLEGSQLFEIAYDNSSTIPKEFKATLRTTTFIRSIPEAIILTITATDVDRTGDPRRTATATVKVLADSQFELPDEPIFSQPFYMANYTKEHEFILQDSIYLRQGYDSEVKFSLDGQFSENFKLVASGNQITFTVTTLLPEESFQQREIYLTVIAQREYTSGANAMIVLLLPEARALSFEKPLYSGTLEGYIVAHESIILSIGNYSDVTFNLKGQYEEYFAVKSTQNTVLLELQKEVSENIIKKNNFIALNLVASGINAITTSTAIFLEIIKPDYETPVFSQKIYNGLYSNDSKVNFQDISLFQGFDETVMFELVGDHAKYFSMETTNNNIVLALNSTIPEDLIFNEKVLLFNIVAEKPRTVGANTAVALKFPEELTEPTILKFTKNTYNGVLKNGKLTVEDIILKSGFTSQTNFTLNGDFNQDFTISNTNNVVTIAISNSESVEEIEKNKFVVLEIEATGERAVAVTTSVIIDIPKIVIEYPVFEKSFYRGSYTKDGGLEFTEEISLRQGYDSSVQFSLEGESSQWFSLIQNEMLVKLISNETNPLPDDLIDKNSHLLFTIVADKLGTIGGRAAIHVEFPKETEDPIVLQFEKREYIGRIENESLQLDKIRLLNVRVSSVALNLTGEFASYFRIKEQSDSVTIELLDIPKELLENNNFFVLNMEASHPNAFKGHTTIILDIVRSRESQLSPIFEQAYYVGEYSNHEGLILSNKIKLSQGFDKTVSFELKGDSSQWFDLLQKEENSFTLSVKNDNLNEVTNQFPLIFTIVAHKTGSKSARATIIITFKGSETEATFSKVLYNGILEDGVVSHEPITISGYDGTDIQIIGDYESSFEVNFSNSVVTIRKAPSAVFPVGLTHVALTLRAGRASAVLLLDVTDSGSEIEATFSKVLYNGRLEDGAVSHETITITGYKGTSVQIIGAYESSFEVSFSNGIVTIRRAASAVFPVGLTHIALTLQAGRASAVLLLDITHSGSEREATFNKVLYSGRIENGVVSHDTITIAGFDGTTIQIIGAYASSFEVELVNGIVTIRKAASAVFPVGLTHIALTLQAGRANAVLLLDVTDSGSEIEATFSKVLYSGKLENGVVTHETIAIIGYDGTNVLINGEHESLFEVNLLNGVVTIRKAASAVIPVGLTHIALTIQAGRANAVLLLDITDTESQIEATFSKVLYNGKLENGVVSHETIAITGYEGTRVQIIGIYETSFEVEFANGIVTIRKAASAVFPVGLTHIALTLQAGRASAVLLLDVTDSGSEIEAAFSKILYNGNLENGVLSHETITIIGYHGTNVQIIGAYESLFEVNLTNGVVTVRKAASAMLPVGVTHIALTLQAGRASAVLLLDVTNNGSEIGVTFSKVLYNGNLKNGVLSHETITVFGYDGTSVQIVGAYESSFEVEFANGIVTIRKAASAVFPVGVTHIALTLQAGRASAVLLIDVTNSGDTDLPAVTFSRTSYFLWADINQTGVVGKVQATAENGERILYSLQVDDDNNLRERISINNEGEILLSAAVQSGIYSFIVTATAENSRVNATASVLLRVEALRDCGSDIGLPPLIVLEKPEEEPHKNLVILNQTEYKDCRYNILNSWPADQSWLYVDEEGLHAKAIDREHESIAFMTLSQIQVELILQCDSDEVSVAKRSLNTERLQLGPDEYGSNKWILADTIVYDARRSFVNLIVNDINDNKPIFIGNVNETIYVGFPVTELEDVILPRALTELKATDADVGENAALIYWSTEDNLAVAPKTGFVHVRNTARLENNSRLTVYATDLNGKGLTGTLDIVVKLLNKNQIAVITVRNAFLDDEDSVLNDLSEAIGYEIKVLRTVVISENNEDSSRKRRDVESSSGASLQLYVYGLQESEPVDVLRLTSDINNSEVVSVNVARVLSLEDHLEGLEICTIPGRDTVLFVTTIVLAVLLLIVIVVIFVWFILIKKFQIHLKWRKKQNYDQFNDTNSLESRNSAMEPIPKVEIQSKPRLNIEELKRSERRLQEMLDTPIQEIQSVEPVNAVNDVTNEFQVETILDIPNPISPLPIVIQSIDKLKTDNDGSDDEDEFGEKKEKPRKSVVTFNENVEKIIHLEDNYEDRSEPDLEVYKF
ncbi:uncharacterized protein LOC126768776 isoform X1 [Nymphalis io]|uniref:uncharacterized protein LOC126768776 isoform X1 n=1 Tax=Inachis io TaxID=171585 RepID=UPI002167338D|nr:uncharacterized protein LOC126768776 isoform X1 [Nymphalis io]